MPRHDTLDGINNTFITKIPTLSDGAVLRLGFEKLPTGIKVYIQVLENGKLLTYSQTETAHTLTLTFKTPVKMNTKRDIGYNVKDNYFVDLGALYKDLRFYFYVLNTTAGLYLFCYIMNENGDLVVYHNTYITQFGKIQLSTPVDLNS